MFQHFNLGNIRNIELRGFIGDLLEDFQSLDIGQIDFAEIADSAAAAKKGKPVPVLDGLLAATALHHDLMLATRNDRDVSGTGVATLNPWR